MSSIRILGIGTSVPEHSYDQASVRPIIRSLFNNRLPDVDRLLDVFDHDHIQQRHFVRDPSWYAAERSFEDSNAAYVESATALSRQAALQALSHAGLRASQIGGIVVASTTGLMTPSLDAVLAQELGLSTNVTRLPIFGLGCAAGVSGLARAAELSKASGGAPYLFIAVEVCSVTFQHNDMSKSNLVGSSIFADGAAAVVIGDGGRGLEVLAPFSTLFPDTYDIMGWDISNTGLKVRFSRDIPAFMRRYLPSVINDACRTWQITADEINTYITHPGGAKVLEAFAEAAGIMKGELLSSYEVLRHHGNMSSASILFVLQHMVENNRVAPGLALMSALGPGFSSELLLLRNDADVS